MSTTSPHGRLIRMRALKPSELPSHPLLQSVQANGAPELQQFITDALTEGHRFMTSYLPKEFKVKGSNRSSPPSSAHVELLAHEIAATDLPKESRTGDAGEAWFARTSIHENAAKAGTASWEEFDGGLRVDHSQHEKDYTPDVIDANEVLSWNESLHALDGGKVGGWEDVHMSMFEMLHNLPTPLSRRVFSVVVITAKKAEEFIDVQIPVDMTDVSAAKYNKAQKVVAGMYCSIERGELLEGGAKVKWQMATASDAKGVLPMFVQKLGVPGAVVKDVGLFVDWCEKRRKGTA